MKPGHISLLASVAAAQVLEMGLNKIQPGMLQGMKTLNKRATYVESLANNITGGGYYVDVFVGNPPQEQRLVIDTGSSDVWVVAYDADLCESRSLQNYYQDSCGMTCKTILRAVEIYISWGMTCTCMLMDPVFVAR